MKVLIRFFFMSIFATSILSSLGSCQQDVEGCTDVEAENYNPDANVSDGNCTFARDKFIGVYTGTLDCQAPLPSDEEFTVTISEGLSNNAEVLVSFQNVDQPLPELTARIEGNQLIIDPETVDIALDPNMPDVTTKLTYSGEAVIDDSEVNLTGELRVLLVLFGQTLRCELIAVKG